MKEVSGQPILQEQRSGTVQAERPARRASDFNAAAHGLRGLASLMVLLAHIVGGTARHVYPDKQDYVRAIAHPWVLGTFGVELFFVISGFVILVSAMKYGPREFALRRLVRIYPLFFVLSLVFIALNAATNAYAHVNGLGPIVAGLLFVNLFADTEQLTPNAWSLSFEMWFYLLTALVVGCAVKRRRPIAGPAAVAAAIGFVIQFPITVYFLIGVGVRLAARAEKEATRTTRAVEMGAAALLVWSASREHHDYTAWAQFADPTVLLILLSISLFFACALMRGSVTAFVLGGGALRYLGTVSYSLYLVHPFTYFAVRLAFVRFGWFTDDVAWSMALFGAAVVSSSLAAAHLAHLLLERWPYEAVFHQRVYHGGAPVREATA